jgi:GNAT superfamily N-acetyltransferase
MDGFALPLWRLFGEAAALVYRAAPGYEAHLWPDGFQVLTGEAEPLFNVAAVRGGPRAADRLREAAGRCRARDVPGALFVAEEVADRLEPVARELGLQEAGRPPWMVYRPQAQAAPAPTGVYHVEEVGDEAALRAANRLAAAAFEIGPEAMDRVFGPAVLEALGFWLVLARRDGRPVSSVMTTAHGRATVGIWTMATAPAAQRQGAGRALLEDVIARHAGRGAERFYLFSSEAGKPLYDRVGFRTVEESALWLVASSTYHPAH